jgi:hypothetical protein
MCGAGCTPLIRCEYALTCEKPARRPGFRQLETPSWNGSQLPRARACSFTVLESPPTDRPGDEPIGSPRRRVHHFRRCTRPMSVICATTPDCDHAVSCVEWEIQCAAIATIIRHSGQCSFGNSDTRRPSLASFTSYKNLTRTAAARYASSMPVWPPSSIAIRRWNMALESC